MNLPSSFRNSSFCSSLLALAMFGFRHDDELVETYVYSFMIVIDSNSDNNHSTFNNVLIYVIYIYIYYVIYIHIICNIYYIT